MNALKTSNPIILLVEERANHKQANSLSHWHVSRENLQLDRAQEKAIDLNPNDISLTSAMSSAERSLIHRVRELKFDTSVCKSSSLQGPCRLFNSVMSTFLPFQAKVTF